MKIRKAVPRDIPDISVIYEKIHAAEENAIICELTRMQRMPGQDSFTINWDIQKQILYRHHLMACRM